MQYAIEIKNLCKQYPKFALQSVSFTLPMGYIMGFIGENGAGKTTVMKSMLHLVRPDSGMVLLLGQDATKENAALKQQIGVVLDTANFPQSFTTQDVHQMLKRVYSNWDGALYQQYLEQFHLPEKKKFKDLLYSSKNSNPSVRKINNLYNTYLDGSLIYYSNLFSKSNYNIKILPKKDRLLDMSVYRLFNLNEEDIVKVNNNTLEEINNGIYNYFHINPIGVRAYDKLMNKVNKLANTKYRLANNSGSINLLLFTSFFGFIIVLGITIGLFLI